MSEDLANALAVQLKEPTFDTITMPTPLQRRAFELIEKISV
jgi:hypothetical protein